MRLNTLSFYKYEETGKDRLGNPIVDLVLIGTDKGKLSNWTREEIALEGREFTKTHEKLITTAGMDICIQAKVVELGTVKYQIKEITNAGRWRLLTVQTYRL